MYKTSVFDPTAPRFGRKAGVAIVGGTATKAFCGDHYDFGLS